jgi:hypothetical protein
MHREHNSLKKQSLPGENDHENFSRRSRSFCSTGCDGRAQKNPGSPPPDTRRQARFLETDEQAISCFSRCLRANEEALLLFTLLYRATGRLVTVHGAIGFDRGIEENKAFTREGLQ